MAFFLQELVNGVTTGALYALVALGFTMVYGVLKLLNFAHGDLYMVGAYVGFFVIQWFGGPSKVTIPVPLLLVIMFVLAAIKNTNEATSILGQPISFDSHGDTNNGKFFLFKITSSGKYQLIPSS